MFNTFDPKNTEYDVGDNGRYDDASMRIRFKDGATELECLLLEETKGTVIYHRLRKAWYHWRYASDEEVKEILAATGND